MSRKRDYLGNAVAESIYVSIKGEKIDHETFEARAKATAAIADYIAALYNAIRRHSSTEPDPALVLWSERSAATCVGEKAAFFAWKASRTSRTSRTSSSLAARSRAAFAALRLVLQALVYREVVTLKGTDRAEHGMGRRGNQHARCRRRNSSHGTELSGKRTGQKSVNSRDAHDSGRVSSRNAAHRVIVPIAYEHCPPRIDGNAKEIRQERRGPVRRARPPQHASEGRHSPGGVAGPHRVLAAVGHAYRS